MKVAAFLPAKGNSNRIPNKNVMLLDGEPLFLRSLKKLLTISIIDEVYLDTESYEIIDLASEVKCKILHRDPSLATNKTDGNQLFYNEVLHTDADICLQLLSTSPFIKKETIEKGIKILLEDDNYDSVVAVRKEKQYLWKDGKPTYNIDHIPNSIDLDDTIIESMGLYIVRRETALRTKRRIGDNPYLLELNPTESIDVNWPDDLIFGDRDGIVVIPRKFEHQVIETALQKLQNEKLILIDVAKGVHTSELITKYGMF